MTAPEKRNGQARHRPAVPNDPATTENGSPMPQDVTVNHSQAQRADWARLQLLLAVENAEEAREAETKLRALEEEAETISVKAQDDRAKFAAWQRVRLRLEAAVTKRERAEATENLCRLQVEATR